MDWNWAGSKWWKFDFHTHTPASEDYGKGMNQKTCQQITPKEWLLNYMRAGIDCVAVTDHNSGEWVDKLKNALVVLKDENHSEYRPIYLFPGVEISVNGGFHLLAIFSPDVGTEAINDLLSKVGYEGTKGASDDVTSKSAKEVISIVRDAGGIAIPAHVDTYNGIFIKLEGSTLNQIFQHTGIIAMEVVNPSSLQVSENCSESEDIFLKNIRRYFSENLNWTQVLGSDAHHPEGNSGQQYPGSHYTWVKMNEPSLEGLRLALIDGEISVKRSDTFQDSPNVHADNVIETLEVKDSKYYGRGGSPFVIHFNPWLNTAIGARGSGKSTLLEFIRLCLNRQDEVPDTIQSDIEKYKQIYDKNKTKSGLLTQSSQFTMIFRKNGKRFKITYNPFSVSPSYIIEEQVSADEWVQTDGDVISRFPVRIYSQKQIFETAKNPSQLLSIIDDDPKVNSHDWYEDHQKLETSYLASKARERELQSALGNEGQIKGALDDVKHKIKVIEESGHSSVLKEYQEASNKKLAVLKWKSSWENWPSKLKELLESFRVEKINTSNFDLNDIQIQHFLSEVENLEKKLESLKFEANHIVDSLNNTVVSWKEVYENSQMLQSIGAAETTYKQLKSQLEEEGISNVEQYGLLIEKRDQLLEKLNAIEVNKQQIQLQKEKSQEILQGIFQSRQTITNKRDRFLTDTLAQNTYVQIRVISYGNTSSIEDEIRDLLNKESGFDKDIESLRDILLGDDSIITEEKIESFKRAIKETYLGEYDGSKDTRFSNHVRKLNPEEMDRLDYWYPEDALEIKYRSVGKRFQSIQEGSPGQMTAALLAFILSYGDEPLLLDQPEDDLDNQLIYELIVQQVRSIKQNRQIFIVTHNANIVVNGDSENVVSLNAVGGQTTIKAQGSLQQKETREQICAIMEGGKDAFEQRYKRINA
jgi:energy-coupling factor transporter ATP-binding protein EcfA2